MKDKYTPDDFKEGNHVTLYLFNRLHRPNQYQVYEGIVLNPLEKKFVDFKGEIPGLKIKINKTFRGNGNLNNIKSSNIKLKDTKSFKRIIEYEKIHDVKYHKNK